MDGREKRSYATSSSIFGPSRENAEQAEQRAAYHPAAHAEKTYEKEQRKDGSLNAGKFKQYFCNDKNSRNEDNAGKGNESIRQQVNTVLFIADTLKPVFNFCYYGR